MPARELGNVTVGLIVSEAALLLGNGRSAQAANWLGLALRLNPSATLAQIRRVGVFRASKIGYRSSPLARAVRILLSKAPDIRFDDEAVQYLQAVESILMACPEAHAAYIAVVTRLRKHRGVALKTLVAIVDRRFLVLPWGDRDSSSDDLSFYAVEECAEGLSYLLHIMRKLFEVDADDFDYIDETALEKGVYDSLLVTAIALKKYNEAEVMVDAFGYSASYANRVLTIAPREVALEKSIRLGYIQTFMQEVITSTRERGVGRIPSLTGMMAAMLHAGGGDFVELVMTPLPRYVLKIPLAPEFFAPFRASDLFMEDVCYLAAVCREQFCRPDELLSIAITSNLTILDVLKIHRLLEFVSKWMAARLRPSLEAGATIGMRSLVPVFQRSNFTKLLSQCVSEEAAADFIRIMSYEKGDSDRVFDVQYQPLITHGDYVLTPLNILSASNFVRNVLFSHTKRKRAEDPDAKFSMQSLVAEALRTRCTGVLVNAVLKVAGHELEFDVVAVLGNTLLLVECKTSFHPCNVYELRTSYEHILRAGQQLERLKAALDFSETRARLMQRLGHQGSSITEVRTCIVTANRMFNGYKVGAHPIRQAYELINVLETGEVALGQETFRIWRGKTFAAADLFGYLDGQVLHAELFASMEEQDSEVQLGRAKLIFRSWALKPDQLVAAVRARYVRVDEVSGEGGSPSQTS
ncbi:MAG: hypothetical protein WDO56_05535 [Gammaproteobacteria bacterium]